MRGCVLEKVCECVQESVCQRVCVYERVGSI